MDRLYGRLGDGRAGWMLGDVIGADLVFDGQGEARLVWIVQESVMRMVLYPGSPGPRSDAVVAAPVCGDHGVGS